MKKVLFLIFLFCFSFQSHGSHLMGGEITWECIKDPTNPNVGKYILEDTVNEIHNILCKKIKVNFSYNTGKINESIYTDFPTYDIN